MGANGAVVADRVLVAITVKVVVGFTRLSEFEVAAVVDVVLGVDETLLLELALELELDDAVALEAELAPVEVPADDDDAGTPEDELEDAPTMDVDVAEVLGAFVRVEGTGMSAVSLATGESKEPVMESRVNMVENWWYVEPLTGLTEVKLT